MEYQENAKELLCAIRIITKLTKAEIQSRLQLSTLEFLLLEYLLDCHVHDPEHAVTATCLARYLQIAPSSLTRILKRLEKREIIRRIIPHENRRLVHVELTERTLKEGRTLRDDIIAFANTIVGQLGADDTRELIRIMGKLTILFNDQKGVFLC